ncbi:MAG: circularly permuted type 2 ATP-grasp protein, partial [Comamonadaceae bacterium]
MQKKFDEMFARLPGEGAVQFQGQSMGGMSQVQVQGVRDHYRTYAEWLGRQAQETMRARREEAEMIFRRVGITFAVYGAKDEDGSGTERLIPFDLIPRIIPAAEWRLMEKGLVQRVTALNRFIHDAYHDQEIVKAG